MRLKEYFTGVCDLLSEVYPAEEARAMAFILFENRLHRRREDLYSRPDEEVREDPALADAVRQLRQHRPLQYVLGETECCGYLFHVDENVLIPRPETEELVRWITADWHGKTPRILDIGTGSGVIAVSLARNLPGAIVSALDVSPGALAVARENAGRNGANVTFTQADILKEFPEGTFDVIVSNPPYVRESEKERMRRNVLDYEPHRALFVPDGDPLLFYRRIAAIGTRQLDSGGALYVEINESCGPQTADLMSEAGYADIELRTDIFGKDRMLKGVWR